MMSRMPPHEQFVRFAVASYSFPHLTQRAHLTFFNIITPSCPRAARWFFAAHRAAGIAAPRALHVMRPPFSFPRKKTGVARPKERRLHCKRAAQRAAMLANCTFCARRCRVSTATRFASASIIRCRSAYLVGVRTNFRLPPVSTMRQAQQCRIRQAVCRRATVTRASR